jgi:single-strand DNA-binding protein
MLNRAEIIGRITHAPELGHTNSGIAFCNLRIATNRVVSRTTQTEFHTVVAWNALAEQIAQGLAKGEVAYVEGRLEENTWLEHGARRNRTRIVANRIVFLGAGHRANRMERVVEVEPEEQADEPDTTAEEPDAEEAGDE